MGTQRTRHLVTAGIAVVVAAVAFAVAFYWPRGSSGADAYTDPKAQGTITLYDAAGHVVTSGSILDKPFVAKAVQSDAAPAPYNVAGAKATLLAYQPRQGAPADQWSGDTLTGAYAFPDPARPSVVAQPDDFTLEDFLDEFPARWDGRVQLRIYLSAPDQPVRNSAYAVANLVVSGGTWHQTAGSSGSTGSALPRDPAAPAPVLVDGRTRRAGVAA